MPARWRGRAGDRWLWRDRERLHTWQPRTREGDGLDPFRLTRAVPRAVVVPRRRRGRGVPDLATLGDAVGLGMGPGRPGWGGSRHPWVHHGRTWGRRRLCQDEPPVRGQTGDAGPLRAATTVAPEPPQSQLCSSCARHHRRGGSCTGTRRGGCHGVVRRVRVRFHRLPPSLHPVPPGMTPSQHRRAGGILVPGRRWRGGKVPRGETVRT